MGENTNQLYTLMSCNKEMNFKKLNKKKRDVEITVQEFREVLKHKL